VPAPARACAPPRARASRALQRAPVAQRTVRRPSVRPGRPADLAPPSVMRAYSQLSMLATLCRTSGAHSASGVAMAAQSLGGEERRRKTGLQQTAVGAAGQQWRAAGHVRAGAEGVGGVLHKVTSVAARSRSRRRSRVVTGSKRTAGTTALWQPSWRAARSSAVGGGAMTGRSRTECARLRLLRGAPILHRVAGQGASLAGVAAGLMAQAGERQVKRVAGTAHMVVALKLKARPGLPGLGQIRGIMDRGVEPLWWMQHSSNQQERAPAGLAKSSMGTRRAAKLTGGTLIVSVGTRMSPL
jgi:hypothetical protein